MTRVTSFALLTALLAPVASCRACGRSRTGARKSADAATDRVASGHEVSRSKPTVAGAVAPVQNAGRDTKRRGLLRRRLAELVPTDGGTYGAWGELDPSADVNPRPVDGYARRLVERNLCPIVVECTMLAGQKKAGFARIHVAVIGARGLGAIVDWTAPDRLSGFKSAVTSCVKRGFSELVLRPPPSTGRGRLWVECTVDPDLLKAASVLRGTLDGCYRHELRQRADAGGELRLMLAVGPRGRVQSARVLGDGNYGASFVTCVRRQALKTRLPPPSGGSALLMVPLDLGDR